MAQVKLRFSGTLTQSDPNQHPVVIVGQLKNLHRVSYEVLKVKLEPRVTEEVCIFLVYPWLHDMTYLNPENANL